MSVERLSPRIVISRDIRKGSTPYYISVHEQEIDSFLSSRGVPAAEFPNLKIRISSEDLGEAANTVYEDKTDVTVAVSTGYAWKQYQEALKRCM